MTTGEELIASRAGTRSRSKAARGGKARRFRWAIAGLIVIGFCSLGAAMVLSGSSARAVRTGPAWSASSSPLAKRPLRSIGLGPMAQ